MKLSEETWSVPEHKVSDVFVETLEESIDSLNVTEIEVSVETEETPSTGEIEATTG